MKKILIIVGTRPNFIKITQFPRVVKVASKLELKIVHTGQHFDDKMSKIFFDQFCLQPDIFLNVEGGDPEVQMLHIQTALKNVILNHRPDLMLVVGDVNSTAAAALVAKEMNIKVAHVESGLRSFDDSMPEEKNRIIADSIADYFFVTEQSGVDNLIREGKPMERIFFVGNTMIDTMVAFRTQIDSSDILTKLNIEAKRFVLMTMHRPATVDSKEGLGKLIQSINEITKKYKIVFPIHPRTIKKLHGFDLFSQLSENKNLILTEALDYFSFQKLIKECKFIITDSGGIQEESTFLGIPCLTLRPNTERPSTILIGTNELVPFNISDIQQKIMDIETGLYKKGNIPPLWDGKATERIVDVIKRLF
jgi:UDP-N-acetylglucosamine 2-epimerase (non-hydrolysing)